MILQLPSDFFTPESMFTFAGATAITAVITNVLQHVFNWNPKWFGLLIGILLGIGGVCMTENPDIMNYVVGVINGFLIYASAAGIMEMGGNPVSSSGDSGTLKRRFCSKWY